jgi:hypothetical protein
LKVNAGREIYSWHGIAETLCFKGFDGLSIIFDENSFTYSQIVIGNFPAMF